MSQLMGPKTAADAFEMIMILFQSPACWNLPVVVALVSKRKRRRRRRMGWDGGGLLVKAAEQKGKAMNSRRVRVDDRGSVYLRPNKNWQKVSDSTCFHGGPMLTRPRTWVLWSCMHVRGVSWE